GRPFFYITASMKHSSYRHSSGVESGGVRRSALSIVFAVAIATFLGSCASLPQYDPSLPQVSIVRATESDIRQFGKISSENPYIEPRTLLRGKTDEFFILRIDFNLPENAEITIVAKAEAPAGKKPAKAYSAPEFRDFWNARIIKDNENDALNQRKYTSIDRSCVPSFDFRQKAGRGSAFLPFASENPMPRPMLFRVEVSSSIGPGAVYEFTLE
ncbi:MAG TPA: hypothetical protein VIO60_04695, partial [Rectinemataceae bacterium]